MFGGMTGRFRLQWLAHRFRNLNSGSVKLMLSSGICFRGVDLTNDRRPSRLRTPCLLSDTCGTSNKLEARLSRAHPLHLGCDACQDVHGPYAPSHQAKSALGMGVISPSTIPARLWHWQVRDMHDPVLSSGGQLEAIYT